MNQNKTLKSEEDWKKELNEAQYTILRKKGTERPHAIIPRVLMHSAGKRKASTAVLFSIWMMLKRILQFP